LVRCLTRLIEPIPGTVRIAEDEVTSCSESKLRDLRRNQIAMVFQHFGLLPHKAGHRQRRLRGLDHRHHTGLGGQVHLRVVLADAHTAVRWLQRY
jgi:ABC-type phosphate/phosphonate transport system ATPase subunit